MKRQSKYSAMTNLYRAKDDPNFKWISDKWDKLVKLMKAGKLEHDGAGNDWMRFKVPNKQKYVQLIGWEKWENINTDKETIKTGISITFYKF